MARFSFSHCPRCSRLNIHGSRCVCTPLPILDCDCEGGNKEHAGPICAKRESDDWFRFFQRSREIARQIVKEHNA